MLHSNHPPSSRDFSGKVTPYSVKKCIGMPIMSEDSLREIKMRGLWKRTKKVIGHQWAYEVTKNEEMLLHYDELDAYTAHWGDERAGLAENSTRVIDFADMSDRMRELLVGFDPMWKDDREFCDAPCKRRRIVNPRSDEQKRADEKEKEALLRELDAFDQDIGVQRPSH